MLAPRCLRCAAPFEPASPRQDHCTQCGIEVARLIAADEKRRKPRFAARDFTDRIYAR